MTTSPATDPARAKLVDSRPGLAVEPFRGLRYQANVVSDLARVTSPPYDVVDADGVRALESIDPHNVVRLILPREDDCGPTGRYEHAAQTLRAWVASGILKADADAGLYLYEQAQAGVVLQAGLIAAVALRDPADRVILPHEDTMPGPVADRLELMRAAQANIEPIFLVYDGTGGATTSVLSEVVTTQPLLEAHTDDGIDHRLWAISDPKSLAAVQSDLADRTAMIADGHHRYAAYRALQAEHSSPGPWDFGLALLVDVNAFPPAVGAIHRTVVGLTLTDACQTALEAGFQVADSGPAIGSEAAFDVPGSWLMADATGAWARLSIADQDAVQALVPLGHSPQWRALDTSVLHHALFDAAWQVPEQSISYHHCVVGALDAVAANHGLAILLAPVPVRTVFELAANGERMPRKSTSFGPKPRTGWVLRRFIEG